VYVGQSLGSGIGGIEPALINPVLPIDPPEGSRPAAVPDRTPSYHLMSSAQRSAYLAWLAGGRREARAAPGFVRLFLSGLERRVFVDTARDPSVRAEFPTIASEVGRLRKLLAPVNRSVSEEADAFEQILHLLTAGRQAVPGSPPSPDPGADRWPVPIGLRVALAQFAVCGVSVPARWARVWAWYHPTLFPSTPQTRCPQEFDTLFAIRYRDRFSEGLLCSIAGLSGLRVGYQPISPGLDALVAERPDLPDVFQEPRATRELGALIDSVTEALTPYSRWLARTPGGGGSAASALLLPEDLIRHDPGPLAGLSAWAQERLGRGQSVLIDGRDFAPFWSTADPTVMSREESASLAVVMARIGLGVEPDVRFGGAVLRPGPAVLFHLDGREKPSPSAVFRTAATVLGVVSATVLKSVSDTDGTSEGEAANRAMSALAAQFPLTIAERIRLAARLRWLHVAGPGPATLRRRAESLTPAERRAAGHVVLDTVRAEDLSDASTIEMLELAHRWLGLSNESLHQWLHRRSVEADERVGDDVPVVVRRSGPGHPGYTLPPAPPPVDRPPQHRDTGDRAPSEQPSLAQPEDPAQVSLDGQRIARRLAETREVSCLLTEVFTGEQENAAAPAPGSGESPGEVPSVPTVPQGRLGQRTDPSDRGPEVLPDEVLPGEILPGLDRAHTRLLRDLATGPFWPHEKFKALCDRNGVLPQGAVDVVNEAALDAVGEILLEEDAVSIVPGADGEAGTRLPHPGDLTDDTMGDRTTRTAETKANGWRVDWDVLRDMLG
jgi:hypothetical protein